MNDAAQDALSDAYRDTFRAARTLRDQAQRSRMTMEKALSDAAELEHRLSQLREALGDELADRIERRACGG